MISANIKRSEPPANSKNPNTGVLSLQDSAISSLTRNIVDFSIFKCLRVIYLYDNVLVEVPDLRAVAHTLEELYLQGNEISHLLLDYPMPRLTILNAMRCRIRKVTIEAPFMALSKLLLSAQKPDTFNDDDEMLQWTCYDDCLTSLLHLDISGVPVGSLATILDSIPGVEELIANGCQIGFKDPDLRQIFPLMHDSLRSLQLGSNPALKGSREFRRLVLAAFPALLDLDGRRISDQERVLYKKRSVSKLNSNASNSLASSLSDLLSLQPRQ